LPGGPAAAGENNRMKYSNMKIFVFALLIVLAGLILSGSTGLQAFVQDQQATIRAEVAIVNIVFTVTNRNGVPISGMKAKDFQIFEDKQPQQIDYFSELGKQTDVPLTIAMLIDTSGSVKDKLDFEKTTAAEFFTDVLRPKKDKALIIKFDSEVSLVQDFTRDQNALVKALKSLKAGSNTSLYDAVYVAAEENLKKEPGRKIMLVITDGDDLKSIMRKEDAIEAAQRNDIVIYGIGVQTEGTNFGVLKSFAKETGGAFFSPHATLSEIKSAFESVGRELQGQYSLAYVSTNKKRDGAYRTIDLRCKTGDVRIRARKGYYAPQP
jgi:Ca-activated chloride channel homolog